MAKHSMAVYCGHSIGNNPEYAHQAEILGQMMAKSDIRLVYGGGETGIMGVVANAVKNNGGEVIGITTPTLIHREPVLEGIETEIKDTLLERKKRMIELSDAFCICPGGVGTLNEVSDIMTMHQVNETVLPIYFLNTNGFWDILGDMLKQMIREGFLGSQTEYNMMICDTPEEVIKAYTSRFFD
ncbi:MAG: TIGR00730 family Rossman fold protein [Rickettsiales bacterium]|jgi:uncharacterized protein (TIGR00730 family)|nr:TIGR00730 family Rossman fold protein [Rickettsiales bacterium]